MPNNREQYEGEGTVQLESSNMNKKSKGIRKGLAEVLDSGYHSLKHNLGKYAGAIALAFTLTASPVLTSCDKEDDPIESIDTVKPVCNLLKSSVDISGGKTISWDNKGLYVGGETVATRYDNSGTVYVEKITLDGTSISSGSTISTAGTLSIALSDKSQNKTTVSVKLEVNNNCPQINVIKNEVNVFGGLKVEVNGTKLLIGGEEVANWENGDAITLTFNGTELKSGDSIDTTGKIEGVVKNSKGYESKFEIAVKSEALIGLENLKNLNMQVDKEVNLLQGVSAADGFSIKSVAVRIDDKEYTVADPYHFIPEAFGNCSIIITVERTSDGATSSVTQEAGSVKPLEWTAFTPETLSLTYPKVPQSNGEFVEMPSAGKEFFKSGFELGEMEDDLIKYGTSQEGSVKLTSEQVKQILSNVQCVLYDEKPDPDKFDYMIVGDDFWLDGTVGAHSNKVASLSELLTGNINNLVGRKLRAYGINSAKRNQGIVELAKQYPDKTFFFITTHTLITEMWAPWTSEYAAEYQALKEIASMPNVIIVEALGNVTSKVDSNDSSHTIPNQTMINGDESKDTEYSGFSEFSFKFNGKRAAIAAWNAHYKNGEVTTNSFQNNEVYGSWGRYVDKDILDDIYLLASPGATALGDANNEGSSYASVVTAIQKLYESEKLRNPNLTIQGFVDNILPTLISKGKVYVDGSYYGTSNVIGGNEGFQKEIDKWLKPSITSVDSNGKNLIKIKGMDYANCLVLGPGVVDAQGNPITESNYKNYMSNHDTTDLYINPALLKKYNLGGKLSLRIYPIDNDTKKVIGSGYEVTLDVN